jgi:TonB family protein
MSSSLVWNNLVTYSLQIGLLVALAACLPPLLRLRLPRARLAFWHILLAACLLLPAVRPWKRAVITDNSDVFATSVIISQGAQPARAPALSRTQIALLLLAAGALIRLGWLAAGFARLRRYRRHSERLDAPAPWPTKAELRISSDVSSPVTFGLFKPVVLLPAEFPELEPRIGNAILCHELLHVRRRDWLYTIAEEVVRAIFWFHPAIWWLLGEIQLAREQAVDREVVEMTQARDPYVDALLAIAGARPQLDLAPAPLFLRRRHLKQRVVSILKEVRMSRTRLVSALAAGLGILAAACWFITTSFPLVAAPQVVRDAPGVSVDVGGAALMHRSSVGYPEEALKKGIQGAVAVEATMDAAGNVVDARVLSGPVELRKAALQSVFQWHFAKDAANGTRVVTINFQLPPEGALPAGTTGYAFQGRAYTMNTPQGPVTHTVTPASSQELRERAQLVEELRAKAEALRSQQPSPQQAQEMDEMKAKIQRAFAELAAAQARVQAERVPVPTSRKVAKISIVGLSDAERDALAAKLPVHVGDMVGAHEFEDLRKAVQEFDEHLMVRISPLDNEATVEIFAPGAAVQQIRVGGNAQQTKLIRQPRPMYPPAAKEARISGVVRLEAVIGKDGTVQNLKVLEGPPELVGAALDAVRLWVYEPTLLNGNPVEVVTQIDVNFTLSK